MFPSSSGATSRQAIATRSCWSILNRWNSLSCCSISFTSTSSLLIGDALISLLTSASLHCHHIVSHRGDLGKMIHFFEIFFPCFNGPTYRFALKRIIHCQILATYWEKYIEAWSSRCTWNQPFKMWGQLYHFASCTGQKDTVHGAKWYNTTFFISNSNIQDIAHKITINTIKQFIML